MMRYTINVDGDEKEEELTFSNETLNNYNFISLITPDDKEYIICVSDLVVLTSALEKIKEQYDV